MGLRKGEGEGHPRGDVATGAHGGDAQGERHQQQPRGLTIQEPRQHRKEAQRREQRGSNPQVGRDRAPGDERGDDEETTLERPPRDQAGHIRKRRERRVDRQGPRRVHERVDVPSIEPRGGHLHRVLRVQIVGIAPVEPQARAGPERREIGSERNAAYVSEPRSRGVAGREPRDRERGHEARVVAGPFRVEQ